MADDWVSVRDTAPAGDWQAVAPPAATKPATFDERFSAAPAPRSAVSLDEAMTDPSRIPDAFLDRVRMGQSLQRVMDKAAAGFREGADVATTPTGFEDKTLNDLIELGIFHDPARGGPNAIQFLNEATMMPAAQGWAALMRGLNASLHGAGGLVGQLYDELGAPLGGTGTQAEREVINFGNWAMIEGGMGRFSRPAVRDGAPVNQVIGGLPREADFKAGAEILKSPVAEQNLRDLWQERGIHPAEAVHDAERDAFVRRELTTPERDPAAKLPAEAWTPENLAEHPYELGSGMSFRTARGSEYAVHDDGTTTRNKAARDDIGHEGDQGPKERSAKTVYLTEQDANRLAQPDSTSWRFADHGDGTMSLITRNPDGMWGRAPEQKNVPYSTEPQEGMTPLELWSPEKIASTDAYSKAHFGNQIVEVREGAAAEPPLRALGADVAAETPSLAEQPAPPPGRLLAAGRAGLDTLFDIGRDIQMLTTPMATGTRDSMALAKDFANTIRRNRWEWSRIDADVAKRFTVEQRTRMWDAADEESVARQLGESREHQGLVTLAPEERAAVEQLQARAQTAWLHAVDMGMVEGDGLPAYTPRMIINTASATGKDAALPLNGIGRNLRTRTAQMMRRQHMTAEETEAAAKSALGDGAEIARDIRALPLATAKLEDAIAGRKLVDSIKDYGKRTGDDTVSEGGKPGPGWFTLDHPAFRTWRPKFETDEAGATRAAVDDKGNTIFQQTPIYVRGDFEGPLRAVLTETSGPLYGAMMSLKGKTMSLIMNSPLIHNAVEWGRALPAMPGKVATFKIYFEGNAARRGVPYEGVIQHIINWKTGKLEETGRNANPIMVEAINNGLVPIGNRFFNQDITSIMEEPNLSPGRSLTARVARLVPDLFDPAKPGQTVGGPGDKVAVAIDKAGNFWHNTLLWDRVADLQMGLYTNLKDNLTAKGVDNVTAARGAAHWANRYAGALPQEAMSDAARKIANMMLFSRSFTLGNLGVMKDMLNGLPRDVMAQIERDGGQMNPEAAGYARSLARRKAMTIVGMDMALMYVGNSLLQNVMNVMLGDSTLDKEAHGYSERLSAMLTAVGEHPLKLLQPLDLLGSLSATASNEPGRQERIKVGYAKDGTAIYARNPAGKIGEEFQGYLTGPLDMVRRKLGTVARPVWQIMSNDAGFGRKVYDPNADTAAKYLKNMGLIAAHIAGAQLPAGQMNAFADLVKGEGDAKVNALQAFGPIAGVTFSKGAPGGPAVGEMYAARAQHDFAVQAAMPDIRKQIQRGDLVGAQERMTALGIPEGLRRFYIRTTINPATRLSPNALKNFYIYATPEQRRRLEEAPRP